MSRHYLSSAQTTSNNPGPTSFIIVIEPAEVGHSKAMIFAEGPRGKKILQEQKNEYFYLFLANLAHVILLFVVYIAFTVNVPAINNTLDFEVVNKLRLGAIVRGLLSTPMQLLTIWPFYIASCKTWNCLAMDMDVLIAIKANIIYFFSVYSVIRAACYSDFQGMDFFGTSAIFMGTSLLWRYLDALVQRKRFQLITHHKDIAMETITLMALDGEGNIISKEEIDGGLIHCTDVIRIILDAKLISDDGLAKWVQSHVNENGVLCVRGKSVFDQIAELVQSNKMAEGLVIEFADSISKFFTVLGILSLFFGLAWLLAGKFHPYPDYGLPHFMDSSKLAAQVWISATAIASPCSLSLATRIAVMVATQVGASQGILFNTGKALEIDSKVNCVVFNIDLTDRNQLVVDPKYLNILKLKKIFQSSAAIEANPIHPLANAIIEYAKKYTEGEENLLPQAHDFFSIPGSGVTAVVQDTEMLVGNKRFMVEHITDIPKDAEKKLEEAEEIIETEGIAKIGMLVALNREVIGVVIISYSLKPEAEKVISILRSMNVKSVVATGEAEEKVRKVKNLQEQGYTVAMVDFGASNSPELVAADVGIAIEAGADRISIAKEAADIVLTNNNLEDVIIALDLSNKIFYRNRLNCIFAAVHNMVCIPMATAAPLSLGYPLQPWVAGTIATGSSLALLTSSYLLKFYKKPKQLESHELLSIGVE